MRTDFEYLSCLQYQNKALREKVESFESGEEYRKMAEANRRLRRYYDRQVKEKDKEISSLRREAKKNLDGWFMVFEDVQEECRRKLEEKEAQIEHLHDIIREKDGSIAGLREKLKEKSEEIVLERRKLADEQEKNHKLKGELKENFQNSSIPSSRSRFRPAVPNNREKTDRKPGGQPGHEGHRRRKYAITGETIEIKAPDRIVNNPDYYHAGGSNGEIHKQRIRFGFMVFVDDLWTKVYRNRKTGGRYHAPFPVNMQNEVNYDESAKAVMFIMHNHLNVSAGKISRFIDEATHGAARPSTGMICSLNREFSSKTKEEQEKIFATLASGPVMYTDMTGARMNGKLKNVVVCTNGEVTGYYFKDNKGDRGVAGTPLEFYNGTVVHDHDKTMYHYGAEHQECEEHHLRYLKGAMEMEPGLTWHGKMRALLKEMNETRNRQGRELTEGQIEDFERRYDEIVELAGKEYHDNPPSQYYRKGYNMWKEFRDYKESNLLFLRRPDVDFTNNVSERALRKIGRHMAVSGSFRGKDNKSGEDYCAAMSIIETSCQMERNMFDKARELFARPMPKSKAPAHQSPSQ